MNKTELLAPAGDMECFYAAINAGADAVYLGGDEYGARAYASNFSRDELCEAISYAHIFGVKVYLTVNTLVKEREFAHLTEFLTPFYEAGLDGVIIQDFGVLKQLHDCFPGLELHASTQMCVTSAHAAKRLLQYGVSRVVPARELSLEEIKSIKATGIEVETFIHGAMCYCYSGQCLYSSFLGGRSGNRGRCAGPCRLSYDAFGKKDVYPLSLKDMCTLPLIGEFIDAGIDSFKIEGRMKNPYYVAGVTSIYRKYIDQYKAKKTPDGKIQIDKHDLELLKKLYIRTELQDGYIHRHNGPEMITMQKPGYVSAKEDEFAHIKHNYLDVNRKRALHCELIAHVGDVLKLTVWDHECSVTVEGTEIIDVAQKRPVLGDDIKKQLLKTGQTPFCFDTISVIMDDNIFVSLKSIGEIRRNALGIIREQLSKKDYPDRVVNTTQNEKMHVIKASTHIDDQARFRVSCQNAMQLHTVIDYLEREMMLSEVQGVELNCYMINDLSQELIDKIYAFKEKGVRIYLRMPPVLRANAIRFLKANEKTLFGDLFDGFYCSNLDSLSYIKEFGYASASDGDKDIIADYALYNCNHKAVSLLHEFGINGLVVPYELTIHEWCDLQKAQIELQSDSLFSEYLVYGHIPFMQTANCIKKTFGKCNNHSEITYIKDRTKKSVPIENCCEACENTVYNGVPLLLYSELQQIEAGAYRIAFTVENSDKINTVLDLFLKNKQSNAFEFTKGHFRKGIE